MKLRYSPNSPYVRKVTVSARELGLQWRIKLVETDPWDPRTDLDAYNPLGKVPALILDDGTTLYDSRLICEYLDSRVKTPVLFPTSDPERWQALRRQALADGILDAAVLSFIETVRRPAGQRWSYWMEMQTVAIERALDALEAEAEGFGKEICIGRIAVGCALGYLDFRFAADNWRMGRPALEAWYEAFARRPSMEESVPRDPG